MVDGAGIRAVDGVHRRIGVHALGYRARRRSSEARVQPPDRQSLIAQQLPEKSPVFDAQIGPVDILGAEPGQSRQGRHRRGPLVLGQARTTRQHIGIVAIGVCLRLIHNLIQRAPRVLAVPMCGRCIERQIKRVRPVVALLLEVDGAQVQHTGDQHQPVEIHPEPALQMLGERGAAERAIRLPDHELRCQPTLLARGPEADDLANRLDVTRIAMEGLGLATRDRARIARRHRVDEHQIAVRQQGLGIVDEPVWRRRRRIDIPGDDPARAEEAEVQPYARTPGTAVEDEGNRSRRWVGVRVAVGDIGRQEDLGNRLMTDEDTILVLLLAQHDASSGCLVGQRLSPRNDRMPRRHDIVGRLDCRGSCPRFLDGRRPRRGQGRRSIRRSWGGGQWCVVSGLSGLVRHGATL